VIERGVHEVTERDRAFAIDAGAQFGDER
jgi:hypothetical protein